MSKRPAMMFYTGDWLTDPQLGQCSPATRGIWIDILAAMHKNGEIGELSGTVQSLSRLCRCSPEEMEAAIEELSVTKTSRVTRCLKEVTLVNRRMQREAELRKSHADRQKRYRQKTSDSKVPESDKKVTSLSSVSVSVSTKTHSRDYEILTWWNSTIAPLGAPPLRALTAERLKKYSARNITPEIRSQIQSRIAESKFIQEGSWFSFDWLFKSDGNLAKLLEGNYSKGTQNAQDKRTDGEKRRASLAERNRAARAAHAKTLENQLPSHPNPMPNASAPGPDQTPAP